MKKQLFFLLIGIFFVSVKVFCQDNTFQLKGEIDAPYNGNPIMLFTFQQDTIFSVDTAIIQNGEFFFQGKEYLGDFSIVTTGNYPDRVISSDVILNRGTIYLALDSVSKVWGGELNDRLFVFQDSVQKLYEQGLILSKDSSQSENLERIKDQLKTYIYDFMIENQNNLLGMQTFSNYLGNFIFDSRFENLCDIFDKERKSDMVKSFLEHRSKYSQRFQIIGKKYEDFEFLTPKGNVRKLSDYIGKSKYILLDFWASWCAPCIADMPYLKEIYEKYNGKGFEIISISLDDSQRAWQRGLDKIDAPWIHLSDLKGIKSEMANAYKISGIPFSVILDNTGKIIEVNLRGESLDNFLKQVFDNP
jgi:thiol-disulfide isomerase/thioredoxin